MSPIRPPGNAPLDSQQSTSGNSGSEAKQDSAGHQNSPDPDGHETEQRAVNQRDQAALLLQQIQQQHQQDELSRAISASAALRTMSNAEGAGTSAAGPDQQLQSLLASLRDMPAARSSLPPLHSLSALNPARIVPNPMLGAQNLPSAALQQALSSVGAAGRLGGTAASATAETGHLLSALERSLSTEPSGQQQQQQLLPSQLLAALGQLPSRTPQPSPGTSSVNHLLLSLAQQERQTQGMMGGGALNTNADPLALARLLLTQQQPQPQPPPQAPVLGDQTEQLRQLLGQQAQPSSNLLAALQQNQLAASQHQPPRASGAATNLNLNLAMDQPMVFETAHSLTSARLAMAGAERQTRAGPAVAAPVPQLPDDERVEEEKSSSLAEGKSQSERDHSIGSSSDKKRKRPQKKDKDQPKRPLSAYNIFFRDERAKLMGETPGTDDNSGGGKQKSKKPRAKVGFENLAKIVAQRWRNISKEDMAHYKALAKEDGERYNREMNTYLKAKAKRKTQEDAEDEGGSEDGEEEDDERGRDG